GQGGARVGLYRAALPRGARRRARLVPRGRLRQMILAFLPLAVWLYLVFGRGFFWLTRERDADDAPEPETWPSVVAVVPARDEADVIERSIGSLLAQDYKGEFKVILVDDQSSDGTGDLVSGCTVLKGAPRPPGWTGKLWAVSQGVAAA